MTNDPDTPQMAHLIKLISASHPERNANDIRAELTAIADRTPDYPDPMLPLWEAMPTIPGWPSMGWRMGGGEDYFSDYAAWFCSLTEADQNAYIANHPEPESHQGLYAYLLKRT